MKYVFAAKDKIRITIDLEIGGVALYFPPEEQWLAHGVLKVIRDTVEEPGDLREVVRLLRCIHNKEEEN